MARPSTSSYGGSSERENRQTFQWALTSNVLKGTHKPLIHPPLGSRSQGGGLFFARQPASARRDARASRMRTDPPPEPADHPAGPVLRSTSCTMSPALVPPPVTSLLQR